MKKLLLNSKKMTVTDIAAVCGITAVFVYLFISASFSGTISDEAFYISIPYRLINGDGLFTDEWHLSQLSAVLLYIPVRLFTAVTGGSTGIILFMRRLFAVFQLICSAYAYKILRKNGLPAIFISISFMLFSVIGLGTLSYNTLGVGLLFLLSLTVYSLYDKPTYGGMFLCGSLIAMFILCQPVGIIFYVIYFAAVCYFNIFVKIKDKNKYFPFTLKSFFMTVSGILPVLIFFLYLLFKNSDIKTVIECIPGILSDPEHMTVSETLGIKTFTGIQFFTDMTTAAGTAPLIIAVISVSAAVIIKKFNKNISVAVAAAGLVIFTLCFWYRLFFTGGTTETDDINFFFFPVALSGLAFYLLCNKKNHRVFVLFWCTGILYALFMTVSSNLALHASINGYIISAFASFIFMNELVKELKTENTLQSKRVAAVLLCIFVSLTAFSEGATVCNDIISRAHYTSALMEQGVYKGIYLPSDQTLIYTDVYNDVKEIKEIINETDKVFVLENVPAAYLDGDFSMGVFSGWFIAEQLFTEEVRSRFIEYYTVFPENMPSYIYVPAYMYTQYGLKGIAPKIQAEFAYMLFDGSTEKLGSGILIKVTGLKSE